MSQENEQSLEKALDSTQEVAEGFEHLTKEDLDPDYVAENEQTEESVEADSPTQSEKEAVEYKINGTTYSDDDLSTRMVKDYENLSSFVGKQAEEIGKYKSQLDDLQSQLSETQLVNKKQGEEIDEVNSNKEDDTPIFSQAKIQEMIDGRVNKIIQEKEAKLQEKIKNEEFTSMAKKAGEKFVENNPEYNEDKLVELVNKGKDKGIQFDTANASESSILDYLNVLKVAENLNAQSNQSKEPNDSSKKIQEANKVKSNLSDIGSTEADGRDYDNMTATEWAKLPDNKRAELLGI